MRLKLKSNPLLRKFDRIAGITVIRIFALFGKKRGLPRSEVKKVLLIRFAAMGDTLLMTPAVRAIRNKYPDANLDFLVSNINFSIIENSPYLSKIYKFEFSKKISKLKENLKLLNRLRKNNYDLILDFEPFVSLTALIAIFLKGKYTAGYKTENQKKHFAFDGFVNHSKKRHEVDNLLALAEHIGCDVHDRKTELWIPEEVKARIEMLFSAHKIGKKKIVVIHPSTGGENHPRQWPEEYFVKLIEFLYNNYETDIILIGGKNEKNIAERIEADTKGKAVSLCGQTDLNGTIEIIRRCDLFISGNTGTMHIAAALDKPLIALHGPTDPARFGPLGNNSHVIKSPLHCSPCLNLGFEYGCKEYPCMKFITPNMVIDSIKLINPL